MSDDDLIRRGDVLGKLAYLGSEFEARGAPTAAKLFEMAADYIRALPAAALNTGKEVMPSEPNGSAEGTRNIGPGDQGAVAGAAQKEPSHE